VKKDDQSGGRENHYEWGRNIACNRREGKGVGTACERKKTKVKLGIRKRKGTTGGAAGQVPREKKNDERQQKHG